MENIIFLWIIIVIASEVNGWTQCGGRCAKMLIIYLVTKNKFVAIAANSLNVNLIKLDLGPDRINKILLQFLLLHGRSQVAISQERSATIDTNEIKSVEISVRY